MPLILERKGRKKREEQEEEGARKERWRAVYSGWRAGERRGVRGI